MKLVTFSVMMLCAFTVSMTAFAAPATKQVAKVIPRPTVQLTEKFRSEFLEGDPVNLVFAVGYGQHIGIFLGAGLEMPQTIMPGSRIGNFYTVAASDKKTAAYSLMKDKCSDILYVGTWNLPLTLGDKIPPGQYTGRIANQGCDGNVESKNFSFTVHPRAKIKTFAASSLNAKAGESVIISWTTTGADKAYLNNEAVEPNGSKTVSIKETTPFLLYATGKLGSRDDANPVTVKVEPKALPTPKPTAKPTPEPPSPWHVEANGGFSSRMETRPTQDNMANGAKYTTHNPAAELKVVGPDGWNFTATGQVAANQEGRADGFSYQGAPPTSIGAGLLVGKRSSLDTFVKGLYSDVAVGAQYVMDPKDGAGYWVEARMMNRTIFDNDVIPVSITGDMNHNFGQYGRTQYGFDTMVKLWAFSPTGRGSATSAMINGGLFFNAQGLFMESSTERSMETLFGVGAHAMIANAIRLHVGIDSGSNVIFGASASWPFGVGGGDAKKTKNDQRWYNPSANAAWVLR